MGWLVVEKKSVGDKLRKLVEDVMLFVLRGNNVWKELDVGTVPMFNKYNVGT